MPPEDTRRPRASRARRLHVLELPRAKNLAPHHARVPHPADDRQRKQHVAEAWPEHRDGRDGQQQAGKGQQHIDHPADHTSTTPPK